MSPIVRMFANKFDAHGTQLYGSGGAVGALCQGAGTSGADCHSAVSGPAGALFLRGDPRGAAHFEGHGLAASQGVEGGRTDPGGDPASEGALLHQPGELGGGAAFFCRFFLRLCRDGLLLRVSRAVALRGRAEVVGPEFRASREL